MSESCSLRRRRIASLFSVAVSVLALSHPARAGLLSKLGNPLKHVEPTPAPGGAWNFTSGTFQPFSYPNVDQVSVRARCRYVAPKVPFQWQFEFTNLTAKPLKFRMGLVQINNQAFATVSQHFSKVEPLSIQRLAIAPRRSAAVVVDGRFGCPGMPGGVNADKHYVVILDDLFVGTQVVSSGVFDRYDREVEDQHARYINDNNQAVGEAAAAGIHDGLEMIDQMPNYEVPMTPSE